MMFDQNDIQTEEQVIKHRLALLRSSEQKVCIFGAGKIGKGRGYHCLQVLDIKVDVFCDNNPEKWGEEIVDGIICISPSELKNRYEDAFVFIMLGKRDCSSVRAQLNELGHFKFLEMNDVVLCDEHVDNVLKIHNWDYHEALTDLKATPYFNGDSVRNETGKPIAVYMCVTGGYDSIHEPEMVENDVDYYMISDFKKKNSIFKFLDVNKIVPDQIRDNVRKNRFCKILGCDIFSEYQYSIYLDGNSCICGRLSEYLGAISELGLALRSGNHKPFNCIFTEGAWAIENIGDEETVRKQMHKYREEGMPRHWGMFDLNCIVRENNNKKLINLMREWWNEVYTYSFRDRLSFTYILWKNGIKRSEVGIIDDQEWDHAKEYYIVNLHR